MVNALFISYPGEPINPTTFLPDNGLASLAGSLIQEGHSAHILDYGTIQLLKDSLPEGVKPALQELFDKKNSNSFGKAEERKILEIDRQIEEHRYDLVDRIGKSIVGEISGKNIDFVGFKSWMGDAYPALDQLTGIIKKTFPEMPIIVGGPQVTSFGEIMAKDLKNVDFLCYDEGELTVVKFAQYLGGKSMLKDIPNLMYVRDGRLVRNENHVVSDLDDLAMPVYDPEFYPATRGNEKFNMMVIDESRRCYYRCPFCIESSKVKGRWRPKSAKRVVSEIKHLNEKYGIGLIRFGGQMTPGNLMEDISRLVLDEGLDIEFSSFSHISTMKDADFKLMKKAGLYSLFFGVESGNQEILSTTLGKKTNVQDIEYVLKRAHEAGIYTVASLIYPSPGDDEQTLNDTVNMLVRSNVSSAPVQFAGVYPGTKWARNYKEYGFDLDPDDYPRQVIDYKIKNIFPPQFWEPVQVRIDGKSFFEYVGETGKMIYALESRGILTDITDEQALLAKRAGISPRELRDLSQRIFYTGDWKRMQDIIEKVNDNKQFT